MKRLFLVFLTPVVLLGADINSLIDSLQKTDPSQRYKVMNQIKRELAKLNAHQRAIMIKHIYKNRDKNSQKHFKNMQKDHKQDALEHQEKLYKQERLNQPKKDRPNQGNHGNHGNGNHGG